MWRLLVESSCGEPMLLGRSPRAPREGYIRAIAVRGTVCQPRLPLFFLQISGKHTIALPGLSGILVALPLKITELTSTRASVR